MPLGVEVAFLDDEIVLVFEELVPKWALVSRSGIVSVGSGGTAQPS